MRHQLAFLISFCISILLCNHKGSKSKEKVSNIVQSTDTIVTALKFPFEKIEFATYDINSFRTKQKNHVYINLYSIIDKKVLVTVRDDDTYHDTLKFYTYQLSLEQLAKLNSVFSNTEHVKDNISTLKDSGIYAGYYDFALVTRQSGNKDSLSYVISLMSSEFKGVYNMLDSVYYIYPDTKQAKSFSIPPYFTNAVYTSYKKSVYLPKVGTLPSFKPEDQ